MPVGGVRLEDGKCPRAMGRKMRIVEPARGYTGVESYGARTLNQLGLPPFDIFTGRNAQREIGYLLDGNDRESVLGPPREGSSVMKYKQKKRRPRGSHQQ